MCQYWTCTDAHYCGVITGVSAYIIISGDYQTTATQLIFGSMIILIIVLNSGSVMVLQAQMVFKGGKHLVTTVVYL